MQQFLPIEAMPLTWDIVWCRFPLQETPKRPGPKARPVLVRAARVLADKKQAVVSVVYGTSKIVGEPPNSLIIDDDHELLMCGLSLPTCFHLDRNLYVPWTVPFFPIAGEGIPRILGQLPQSARLRLASIAGR